MARSAFWKILPARYEAPPEGSKFYAELRQKPSVPCAGQPRQSDERSVEGAPIEVNHLSDHGLIGCPFQGRGERVAPEAPKAFTPGASFCKKTVTGDSSAG